MSTLFSRVARRNRDAERSINPLGFQSWTDQLKFNGLTYPHSGGTLSQSPQEISHSFSGYVEGVFKNNGPVFACMEVRRRLFSEARFQFQNIRNGQPGELFGTPELKRLEQPWVNGTTRDLTSRMIQDVDLAGNFYGVRNPNGIWRLRPDWVTVVSGSPRIGARYDDYDSELIGYVYEVGGPGQTGQVKAFLPEEVCHWMPTPDPAHRFLGMSWITPVITEILGDKAASIHKLKFFENGATPNLIMAMDPGMNPDTFKRYVELFREQEEGLDNAYQTLFTTATTVQVVGADLQQLDFKVTQGAGETRIASAAGIAPIIAGFSEGLQAATYSNYASARRHVADGTLRPLWGSAAEALGTIITVPGGSRLTVDDRFISFLQEDKKDDAEIKQIESTTARTLIEAGYEPQTVQTFIQSGDWSVLKHTDLVSVQLQPPGTVAPAVTTPDAPKQLPPGGKASAADVLAALSRN